MSHSGGRHCLLPFTASIYVLLKVRVQQGSLDGCVHSTVKLAGACMLLTTSCYHSHRFPLPQSITLMGGAATLNVLAPDSESRALLYTFRRFKSKRSSNNTPNYEFLHPNDPGGWCAPLSSWHTQSTANPATPCLCTVGQSPVAESRKCYRELLRSKITCF